MLEALKPVIDAALPLVISAFRFRVTPTFLVIFPPVWSST